MTKAKISQYDAVAANNTDVNGVNIAENCPPSGMNNMGREIMAALKRFQTGSDSDGVTVGGNLVVSGTVTAANTATLGNVDVNGGTIDGTTIGGASAAVGTFTQVNVDNLRLDGNAITSTNTNGNIALTPNGVGEVDISKVDIDSGTIDGTAIGGSTAAAGSFTTLNTSGQVVFNDAGADVDFRVEGDTDANLLFVDASADKVGVGTTSPTEKLTVSGNASLSGNLAFTGTGNRITGDFTNATAANRVAFQTSTANAATNIGIIPNGTSQVSALSMFTGSTPSFSSLTFRAGGDTSDARIIAGTDNASAGFFPLTMYTGGSERMRIDSSGNLALGTTTAAGPSGFGNFKAVINAGNQQCLFLDSLVANVTGFTSRAASGNTTGYFAGYFQNAGNTNVGNIAVTNTGTAFNTASDYRLKHDIQPITGALAKVAALKPCTYKWNSDDSAGEGFIAHELQEVAPYAVSGEKDGEQMQGVDYGKLTPILTAALQEAIAKIKTLEARIAALEAK